MAHVVVCVVLTAVEPEGVVDWESFSVVGDAVCWWYQFSDGSLYLSLHIEIRGMPCDVSEGCMMFDKTLLRDVSEVERQDSWSCSSLDP